MVNSGLEKVLEVLVVCSGCECVRERVWGVVRRMVE
jgi:hypothetical protein